MAVRTMAYCVFRFCIHYLIPVGFDDPVKSPLYHVTFVLPASLSLMWTSVYKITAGHRSISDHFKEIVVQIVAWLVLPSDHILSCVNTLRKLAGTEDGLLTAVWSSD